MATIFTIQPSTSISLTQILISMRTKIRRILEKISPFPEGEAIEFDKYSMYREQMMDLIPRR